VGSSEGLQRALMLLALASVVACKAREPEREPAGEAPPFHDQRLYAGTVVLWTGFEHGPHVLPVDVQRDVIHVGELPRRSFPRARGGTVTENLQGAAIPVPNNDAVMLWRYSGRKHHQVRAAKRDAIDLVWTVLEYGRGEVLGEPLVVGDRVAVMSDCCLAHASIMGGPPTVLALQHEPHGNPKSDGRRLVWVAEQGDHQLVLSTDARFEAVEVVWEQPLERGYLRAAAPVGETVVFISATDKSGAFEDQVLRVRADGSLVEVLPREAHGEDLRLLADGQQAWIYSRGRVWWIGERGHSSAHTLGDVATAIGADDGLLLWQQADGIHVAGQPEIEFEAPFPVVFARGGDDEDVWNGPVGNEVGEAYGVGGLHLIEKR
jgi:hypothetical protein